jgi:hypothetical protein
VAIDKSSGACAPEAPGQSTLVQGTLMQSAIQIRAVTSLGTAFLHRSSTTIIPTLDVF